MWLVNFVWGKNCLLEKSCWVNVGGRNLRSGSSETTLTYINAGATWRARGADNPEEVAAAYEAFITELKANPTSNLKDGTTMLSKAYYGFWAAHNLHKHKLR
jgi:hypothetical protein